MRRRHTCWGKRQNPEIELCRMPTQRNTWKQGFFTHIGFFAISQNRQYHQPKAIQHQNPGSAAQKPFIDMFLPTYLSRLTCLRQSFTAASHIVPRLVSPLSTFFLAAAWTGVCSDILGDGEHHYKHGRVSNVTTQGAKREWRVAGQSKAEQGSGNRSSKYCSFAN